MNPIKKFIYQYGIPLVGRLFHGKNKLINVIYYHDIVRGEGHSFQQTNIDVFKRQMEYIARQGYKTLRFDDLNEETLKFDSKSILIAFDDGWKSNYTEIYTFMKSLGIKYNIYLAVREIGENPDYLTWEQVQQMHNEGLVGFGAHTYTHADMTDISQIDPKVEFDKADSIFRKHLGYQPLDFCYPYGKYSEEANTYIIRHTPAFGGFDARPTTVCLHIYHNQLSIIIPILSQAQSGHQFLRIYPHFVCEWNDG